MQSSIPTRDTAERARFLRVAAISIASTVLLSRGLDMLRTAIQYNTTVPDAIYDLVYYLGQAMYSAALGVGFAMIVCAFFLYGGKTTLKTVLLSVMGTTLFHATAFFVDLANGYIESPLSMLSYYLILILFQLLLETAVLLLVLWLIGRKDRTPVPVHAPFSVKSKPQLAMLIFSAIFFAECFYPDVIEILRYLDELNYSIYFSEFLMLLGIVFEDLLLFFIVPYGTMVLLYALFANKKSEKTCV